MNSLMKLIILGGLGGIGVLASGFVDSRIPVFIMDYLNDFALLLWGWNGVIDVSLAFNCLYVLTAFEIYIACLYLYRWITDFLH